MDRAETVTLFNDMCLLAPGTLIDPETTWEAVDATTARARFTYEGQAIAATLLFASTGELVNFSPMNERALNQMVGSRCAGSPRLCATIAMRK